MSLKNTNESYGNITIAIHWLMAILVIGMIFIGFFMESMDKGPDKIQLINLHKATGFLVLLLALYRWFWTLTNEKPRPLANWSQKDILIGKTTKWLLMIILLVMPLSGWINSMSAGHGINFYGLFEIPAFIDKNEEVGEFFEEIHELGAWVISILVALHIAAAAKHHLLVKDDTLRRMLGR